MKIYRFFIFCLSLFIVISCNSSKEDNNKKSGIIETPEVSSIDTVAADLDSPERFEMFLQRFSDNESFQLQRIKFPINVIVPDMSHEGMAPIEENIGRYDWDFLDLNYDSTFLTRPYDQYYQVVRFNKDTAVVEIRGINNGIYADYYFTLIDREWYLTTLYEASF